MKTELSKTYAPQSFEDKWYSFWLNQNLFHAEPDQTKESFTIVIPPPNVTGVLHMGHMLNNTIQDVLTRRARMQGKNACWVPGTDHASIATEAKVVQMLRERGTKKSDLSREDFLKYAWEWKEKYGGIILEQLKKIGASCDWERTRFTMEPSLSEAVIDVFIDLHKKGMIYRGLRMVNWDPQGKTALSDEEVIHKEVNSKLYYIKYAMAALPAAGTIAGNENFLTFPVTEESSGVDYIVIATTRPETILADAAICVNPNDARFKHLVGKKALVPFINREIPIIADEYVSMDFGTGCLKVTPAHDVNDYALGQKYNLPVYDILTEEGFLNELAIDARYIGKERFAVRKQIVIDLEEAGHIVKIEEYKNQVGTSERTGAVIEPRLSLQWWVDMKKFLAKNPQVLDAVMSDEIKFHPAKMKNTYKHWIDNIKDWCISRQLWWGQRIPAWYDKEGNLIAIAKTASEAIAIANANHNNMPGLNGRNVNEVPLQPNLSKPLSIEDLHQDEDVLDTWFSSWLWPISVFDGFKDKDNDDINYFYPTQDLVTAPEIMFFWVARMIMAGYEWRGEKPFSNVYYTGIVRDKQRRKMSKSLGNSPDPLDLIAKFGADGVRMGMLLCSPAGNDILFDESQVEQGRNFANKIWNAFRLVNGWEIKEDVGFSDELLASNKISAAWFRQRFNNALTEVEDKFKDYRLSEALMCIYKLIWDDFCAWYLEMIKPVYGEPIDNTTYNQTILFFEDLMKLLHPFMPFITEELWQNMAERKQGESICIASYPLVQTKDTSAAPDLIRVFETVQQIRNLRNAKGLSPKESLEIYIRANNKLQYEPYEFLIQKLANVSTIYYVDAKVNGALLLPVDTDEIYIYLNMEMDTEAEKEKISKEIEYLQGFLKSVDAKLSNEKFMANAKPDLVEKERQKKADA
ncbi:MAG: valine--tRNA ligase, partial [Bacteroidia bacterium]|nr:valine--tRNA ligase [Bacteroidia bacterium]